MAKSKAERGRFSSRKKVEAVLRVLRGEDLDLVSRELSLTAATLSAWRDQFLASGQAGLKSRAAEGNGIAERFIRTLKEQLLGVRTFRTVAELQEALQAWLVTYNEQWLVERHGFRSPAQVRRDLLAAQQAA